MPTSSLALRVADVEDAEALTELALRSKASWGYTAEFMRQCRDELSVTPEQLRDLDYHCVVAECAAKLAGFAGLRRQSESRFALEALFVAPDFMRQGVGRALFQQAVSTAAGLGGRAMLIQSDPNAACFYQAMGASLIGQQASCSIAGRLLPLFRLPLVDGG